MRLLIISTLLGFVGAATFSLDVAAILMALGALGTGGYNFLRVRQNRPVVAAEIEDRAVARMRTALDAYAEDNARLRADLRVCGERVAHLEAVLRRSGLDG